jgi:uncharacterized protein (DUF433 family)
MAWESVQARISLCGQSSCARWLQTPTGGRPRIDQETAYPEDMNALLSRISVDPAVCFGKPCVRGTRIWVSLLLDFLSSGATIEDVLKEYPQLVREDVLAAIAYGAEMSRERIVEVTSNRI